MATRRRKHSKAAASNITFKRRFGIYYWRSTIVLKSVLVVFLSLFFFTNLFADTKTNIKKELYNTSAEAGFVLKNIIIQGQVNTPSREIIEAIGANKGEPIFSVPINDVKLKLENNPWVKNCIIERRLPDTIYIALFERQPIAIWQFNNKLYLIDESGDRISSEKIEKFPDLVQVVGEGANLYARNLLEDLAVYPKIAGRVRTATRFGNRRWNFTLDEDILVKMPEDDFNRAYKYLQRLDQENKLFRKNIKSFDLRLSDRYFYEKK